MMKRNMQANEIRTNIVFEFAVVGEVEVRQLYKDISGLLTNYQSNAEMIRLVGVNLKKPTANMVYLNGLTVQVDTSNRLPMEVEGTEPQELIEDLSLEVEGTDPDDEGEEEDLENDKESD